jgi:hypothetical protein
VPHKHRNRKTAGAASIPRLISCAFYAAQTGDRAKAIEFWSTAISRGYVVSDQTARRLGITLRQGMRDVHGTDPGFQSVPGAPPH